MEFLSCTVLHKNLPKHFFSADEAIGFIEDNLMDGPFSYGAIIVTSQSEKTEFTFENQEAMLENLMNC